METLLISDRSRRLRVPVDPWLLLFEVSGSKSVTPIIRSVPTRIPAEPTIHAAATSVVVPLFFAHVMFSGPHFSRMTVSEGLGGGI